MSDRVPDTNTFTLRNVVDVVQPSVRPESLSSSFAYAVNDYFDPLYVGNKTALSNFRNYGADETFDYSIPIKNVSWGFNGHPFDWVELPENYLGNNSPAGLLLIVGDFTGYTSPSGEALNGIVGNIILYPSWEIYWTKPTLVYIKNNLNVIGVNIPTIRVVKLISSNEYLENGTDLTGNLIILGGNFYQAHIVNNPPYLTTGHWFILKDVETSSPSIFIPSQTIHSTTKKTEVNNITLSSIYLSESLIGKRINISGVFNDIITLGTGEPRGFYQWDTWNKTYAPHASYPYSNNPSRTSVSTNINNNDYVVSFNYLSSGSNRKRDTIHLFKNGIYISSYSTYGYTKNISYGDIRALNGVLDTTELLDGEDTFYFIGGFTYQTYFGAPDVNSNHIGKCRIDTTSDTLVFNENFVTGNTLTLLSPSIMKSTNYYDDLSLNILKTPNDTLIITSISNGYFPETITIEMNRLHILDLGGNLISSVNGDNIYLDSRLPTQPNSFKLLNNTKIFMSKGYSFNLNYHDDTVFKSFAVYLNNSTSGTIQYYRNFGTMSLDGTQFDI